MSVSIQLTRGYSAIVDESDEEFARSIRWRSIGRAPRVYAYATIWSPTKPKILYLHRALLGAPHGLEVDHINGDSLDNRRSNLRLVTHRQNGFNQKLNRKNTSGYAGVYLVKGRWRAHIKVNGHQIHLGTFDRIEDAAAARAQAETEHFGDFRRRA